MKKLKSVGQCFVALALVFVLFVSLFETAHAVDGFGGGDRGGFSAPSFSLSSLFENLFIYVEAKESNDTTTANEALSVIYRYWVHDETSPFHDNGFNVVVSPDELASIAAELTMNGFPCEVVSYGYTNAGGVYRYVWVIQGSGYMYLPGLIERDTSGAGGRPGPEYALDGRYFTIDGQWLYAEGSSSSNVLNSLYNKFVSFYDYIGDLTYLGFSAVNEGIELLDLRLQYLTGYIAGFKDDPTVPSVMSKIDEVITAIENLSVVGGGGDVSLDFTNINVKLDELFASLEVTIKGAADHSAILSKLNSILQQFQKGGYVIADGHYVRTTLYDYIEGIYEKMGSGSGTGGGGVVDASTIVDSIKSFQYDFDDTFSDLKQIYPVEALDVLHSGSAFDWANVNMINSVTPSVPGASASVYRLPDNLSVNVKETDGAFHLSNGGSLPVGLNYKVDGVWEYVELYNGNESKTVTGTDIIITDAFDDQPLSFEVFGKSTQNGTPSPTNPVPVEGQWGNGLPYVHITSGSVDGYTTSYGHDFETGGTPYGHGIPVSSGGNYTDENGQQWLCDIIDWCYDIPGSTYYGKYTKRIGTFVVDGKNFFVAGADLNSGGDTNYCWGGSPVWGSPSMMSEIGSNYVGGASRSNLFWISLPNSLSGVDANDSLGEMVTKFNAYFQKHPVTVYYVLDEPEVYYSAYSYNEPKLSITYNHITADYGSHMRISYATQSPYTALYSDADGNWYKQRNDGSSEQITDSRVDTLNAAFNYKEYDNAADIKFNVGANIVEVSNGELTIDYIKGSKFFNWLYLYLSNFDGGSMDTDALLDKLTDIEDALSNMGGDIDIDNNLDFDIDNDNDSYNVFYVTDPDTGEDTSIVDLSGDALTAFGRFLNFLYQIGFGDALENFGGTVDGLTDFYTDVGNGGVDVWAS